MGFTEKVYARILKEVKQDAADRVDYLWAPPLHRGSLGCSRESELSRKLLKVGGERGGNRTYNLLIKSQLLCQLSYAPTRWEFL